jgi:ribosomal protein S18 acetylase RimI-like enzyme
MTPESRPARIEDVHELAMGMPHVTVVHGRHENPVYQVGGKSFVFFRTPRPDAVDPVTGERYRDVIMFWVPSEADKQSMIQDEAAPFFTTGHFDGHPSVLLRASQLGELTVSELAEVIAEAWLCRASPTRAAAWLSAHRTQLRRDGRAPHLCHSVLMVEVRFARLEDEAALRKIDTLTWTPDVSPAPVPPGGAPFFGVRARPTDVLVAEIDGVVAGYTVLGQDVPLASHAHVLEVRGLAVDPAYQRHGAGRRLMDASVTEARRRGARKLTLRVLGPNAKARQLYESCGFVVEGILRGEFLLDGQYVDDVLMARNLTTD